MPGIITSRRTSAGRSSCARGDRGGTVADGDHVMTGLPSFKDDEFPDVLVVVGYHYSGHGPALLAIKNSSSRLFEPPGVVF